MKFADIYPVEHVSMMMTWYSDNGILLEIWDGWKQVSNKDMHMIITGMSRYVERVGGF